MGYAVLHFDKAIGNDSAMSAHIERTIIPDYVDKSRTYLNKELITFPDGIKNRTQAIQHRIENANLSRKISKNQVRAIRILLSGSNDEMNSLFNQNQINQWSEDNLKWLKETFGEENIVSAVIHLDESTPHIHATLVPIVSSERKKKKSEQNVKKNYSKKTGNRLSANDIMTRGNLKQYQTSYAEAMSKYGLKRGVEGSKAKHTTTAEYYKNLLIENELLINENAQLNKTKDLKSNELTVIQNQINNKKVKENIVNFFTGTKTDKLKNEIKEINKQLQFQKINSEKIEIELTRKINELNKIIDSQKKLISESTTKIIQLKNDHFSFINNVKLIDPKIESKLKILKGLSSQNATNQYISNYFENRAEKNEAELLKKIEELNALISSKEETINKAGFLHKKLKEIISSNLYYSSKISPKIEQKIEIFKKLKSHHVSEENILNLLENNSVTIDKNKLELIENENRITILMNGKNFDDLVQQFHQINKGKKI